MEVLRYDDVDDGEHETPVLVNINLLEDKRLIWTTPKAEYEEIIQKSITERMDKLNLAETEEKIKFIERPPFPEEKVIAKFSSRVYYEPKRKWQLIKPKNIQTAELPDKWVTLTTAYNSKNGFFGAAYWNADHQQLIIAHRGTNAWADLRGVMMGAYTPQVLSAITFVDKIKESVIKFNKCPDTFIHVTITGHSLGGWLAQITTLSIEFLKLQKVNELSFFVLGDSPSIHAHTLVFESPGAKDILEKIEADFENKYKIGMIKLNDLDITTYLLAANVINSFGKHVGNVYEIDMEFNINSFYGYVRTLFSGKNWVVRFIPTWFFKLLHGISFMTQATKQRHAMQNIADSINDGVALRFITDRVVVKFTDLPNLFVNEIGLEYFPNDNLAAFETQRNLGDPIDNRKLPRSVLSTHEIKFFQRFMAKTEAAEELLLSKFGNGFYLLINSLKNVNYHEGKETISAEKCELLHEMVCYLKNALHFMPELKQMEIVKYVKFGMDNPFNIFIGREKHFKEIEETFENHRMVVLVGEPAVGKTELALRFAYSHNYECWHTIWIKAASKRSIENDFSLLSQSLKLDSESNTQEKLADVIYKKLDGNTLLIFDDARKLADIAEYLPAIDDDSKKYHILVVSSKIGAWNDCDSVIPVGCLQKEAAIDLIMHHAPDISDTKFASSLANILSYHPMAIVHATAFINGELKNTNRWKLFKYDYKDYVEEIVNFIPASDNPDVKIQITSWVLNHAINKIEHKGEMGYMAIQLLKILSCFGTKWVPEEVFYKPHIRSDMQKLANILIDYGLIYRSNHQLNMHNLVRRHVLSGFLDFPDGQPVLLVALQVLFEARDSAFQDDFDLFQTHCESVRKHMADYNIQIEAFLDEFPCQWKLHFKCFAELGYFEIVNIIIMRNRGATEIYQHFYQDGEFLHGPMPSRYVDFLRTFT